MTAPAILLADEPTGNLDPHTANDMHDLLSGLARASGTAVVAVTHNRALAQRADRIVTLEEGVSAGSAGHGGTGMSQCQACHEREAVVRLTQIVGDDVTTVHLCSKCAAERGIETDAEVAQTPLGAFLAAMGKGGCTGRGGVRRRRSVCRLWCDVARLPDIRPGGLCASAG